MIDPLRRVMIDIVLAPHRIVRALAGQAHQVPDPKGGDRIEGQAFTPVVGLIQASVLDPGAHLERVEAPFDRPAPFDPAQDWPRRGLVGGLIRRGQPPPPSSGAVPARGDSSRADPASPVSGSPPTSFGGTRETRPQRPVSVTDAAEWPRDPTRLPRPRPRGAPGVSPLGPPAPAVPRRSHQPAAARPSNPPPGHPPTPPGYQDTPAPRAAPGSIRPASGHCPGQSPGGSRPPQ